jgi:hypothetical protein
MTWLSLASETHVLYSQIGLRLVDEFTGGPLCHPVDARLSYQDGAGDWRPLDVEPVSTPAGHLLYPGLGRSAHAATAPLVRYRVQIESGYYRAEYLRLVDALEFDVHPYDDATPPAVVPAQPATVLMLPSPNYPFAGHLRTVRGRTLGSFGEPVPNVEVTLGSTERTLSDERGTFALPLRWAAFSGGVVIDAIDHRTGRTDQISLTLPQDLLQGHAFTLT